MGRARVRFLFLPVSFELADGTEKHVSLIRLIGPQILYYDSLVSCSSPLASSLFTGPLVKFTCSVARRLYPQGRDKLKKMFVCLFVFQLGLEFSSLALREKIVLGYS